MLLLKLMEDKDELPVNVYVKNVGGRPTIGEYYTRVAPATIVDNELPIAELDRVFVELVHWPETLDFGSKDREIQPGAPVFATLYLPDGKKLSKRFKTPSTYM
jgi:hypothetical protein